MASDAPNPALRQVHKVYLLPMANSLDQYLANRLTRGGQFEVVTDPQKADALFTDNIGTGFEQKFEELYPPPEKDDKDDEDKSQDREKDAAMSKAQRFGSFSRSRGTVFLVDRGSRAVIWSVYRPVRSTRPDDTNRRADDIVDRLEKLVKPKK